MLLRALDLDIVLPPFDSRPALKENSTMELYEAVDPNVYSMLFGNGYRNISNDDANSDGGCISIHSDTGIGVTLITVLATVWGF